MKKHKLITFLIMQCVLIGTTQLIAQENNTIKGTVVSNTQEPLIGVSLIEPGTNNRAITDLDGNFSIKVDKFPTSLTFKYIGFESKTINIKSGEKPFQVVLSETVKNLDEVVVVGYGTVKKSDLTGAVSSIKASELKNTPSASIDVALQGKVAGVFISKKSGSPGTTADVKIRGIGSFNAAGPLWVIDGVQQSPGTEFNMNDAESIEILKDASAAAIYGAAAANGVIIVTTKRGKKGETKVNLNSYYGISSPTNLLTPLNSNQLKRLRIEDMNGQGAMTDEQIRNYPLPSNAIAYGIDYAPTNADYNWKNLLFSNGETTNHDISFTKGEENYNFYLSLGYYDEKGTYIDTDFKRYSARLNSDVKLFKWLTAGQNLQFTYTTTNPVADPRYINNYLRVLPFLMPYDSTNQPGGFGYFPKTDADGNSVDIKSLLAGYDGGNPLADELTHKEKQEKYNVNGSFFLKLQPCKQFNILATFSGGFGSGLNHIEDYRFFYHTTKQRNYTDMTENVNFGYGWTTSLVANYNQKFGDHAVTAMFGLESSYGWGKGLTGTAKNMIGDIYNLNLTTAANQTVGASYSNNATQSYFGRLNYNFKDKYLFTAVMRRDASDRFSSKYRWGTFPSFSAAWKINEEDFIRNLKWLANLKLRSSWGILGNSGISQFLYTTTYANWFSNYAYGITQANVDGVRIQTLPNADIKWEQITTADLGLDVGLFKNALTFSIDVYNKMTTDALFNTSLPKMTGLAYQTQSEPSYIMNVGKISNTGADFEISFKNNIGNDLKYTVSANLGTFKNIVLKTNDNNDVLISGSVLGGNPVCYTKVGLPMSTYFGYKMIGVFQSQAEVDKYNQIAVSKGYSSYQAAGTSAGDLIFEDVNNDGHIDSKDITNIGNPWPDFTYGFNVGLNYKLFDFSVFFQGVQGGSIFNDYKSKANTLYLDYNTTTLALNRWTGENSTNENFRMSLSDPNGNESKVSSWYIEDASYLRLKNIQLGYTLPLSLTKKAYISRCRLYISAQNILTFTKYDGMDPEFSTSSNTAANIDSGNYPQNKTFQCGLQLEF